MQLYNLTKTLYTFKIYSQKQQTLKNDLNYINLFIIEIQFYFLMLRQYKKTSSPYTV